MSREYPAHPLVGVGVILLRPDGVLLVRRAKPPAAGAWSLPGGAQEVGERLEDGARRELLEETGLSAGPLEFIGHVDGIHRDPDGRVRYHYTILDFAGLWQQGDPRHGDDVDAAGFFGWDSAEFQALSAEAHRLIGVARQRFGI